MARGEHGGDPDARRRSRSARGATRCSRATAGMDAEGTDRFTALDFRNRSAPHSKWAVAPKNCLDPMWTLQDGTTGQRRLAKCESVLSGGVNRSEVLIGQVTPPRGVVRLLLTALSSAGLARSHAATFGAEKRADNGAVATTLPPRRM